MLYDEVLEILHYRNMMEKEYFREVIEDYRSGKYELFPIEVDIDKKYLYNFYLDISDEQFEYLMEVVKEIKKYKPCRNTHEAYMYLVHSHVKIDNELIDKSLPEDELYDATDLIKHSLMPPHMVKSAPDNYWKYLF